MKQEVLSVASDKFSRLYGCLAFLGSLAHSARSGFIRAKGSAAGAALCVRFELPVKFAPQE